MTNLIDVHTFDGKLIGLFNPTKNYTKDDKKIMFKLLYDQLSDDNAKFTLNTIISDLDIEKGNNFQLENNIDASDILADILTKDYKDLLLIIEEQLSDTKCLGLCNSGRVTRLFQIWCSL